MSQVVVKKTLAERLKEARALSTEGIRKVIEQKKQAAK